MTADLRKGANKYEDLARLGAPLSPTASSSSNNTLPGMGGPEQQSKTMEVAVTVLGLDGIIESTKSKEKSKSSPPKRSSLVISSNDSVGKDESPHEVDSPAEPRLSMSSASIVASFAHSMSTGKQTFLTHIPSLPIALSSPEHPGEMFQHLVYWPTKLEDQGSDGNQLLSTLQFERHFLCEDMANYSDALGTESMAPPIRFIPQSCPILLSISRNGKLMKLGEANIIINGEEKGEYSINVPIQNSIRSTKGRNPVKKLCKNKGLPMKKIKSDKVYFGLKDGAMLRVRVHVSEPSGDVFGQENTEHGKEATSKDTSSVTTSECVPSDNTSQYVPSDYTSECEVYESDTSESSSARQEFWELHESPQTKLRRLRRQLAGSEAANENLHAELAIMRKSSQEKNESMRSILNQSKQKSEETILVYKFAHEELIKLRRQLKDSQAANKYLHAGLAAMRKSSQEKYESLQLESTQSREEMEETIRKLRQELEETKQKSDENLRNHHEELYQSKQRSIEAIQQLRQELDRVKKRYEDAINILRQELNQAKENYNEAKISLHQELKLSKQKSEQTIQTLHDELEQVTSKAEMLPFFETRVNELMKELKYNDTESEIRQYYTTQVVALLGDDEIQSD